MESRQEVLKTWLGSLQKGDVRIEGSLQITDGMK